MRMWNNDNDYTVDSIAFVNNRDEGARVLFEGRKEKKWEPTSKSINRNDLRREEVLGNIKINP